MKEATRLRIEAEREAKLQAHIKKVVDECPPLTPEQRDRLALLLRPPHKDEPLDLRGGSVLDEMLRAE